MIAFLVFTALWVEGQGMHLGANSIRHLMKTLKSTDAYTLTEFYDEGLSHYLWHSGVIALSALLIWRQWRNPFADSAPIVSVAFSALVYGLTYFITTIEAGTAPVGVPFAVGAALWVVEKKGVGDQAARGVFRRGVCDRDDLTELSKINVHLGRSCAIMRT